MPWREQSVMDQREEFVRLALMPGTDKKELCARFGISRSDGYKWLGRYVAEGRAGLSDRSRRPHRSPERTEAAVEAEVVRIRAKSNGAWGGRKIARVMRNNGWPRVPAPSTITEILRRHGQLEQRAAEHPGPYRRFERAQPNELWQMDFKGHFALPRGRCHPLTVIDDHSRYALALDACADERDMTVRTCLTAAFRRYGLPFVMLMDNGPPWGDNGAQPFTIFTVWLMRLGVRVTHGRPYHPQTQGKDERFHRTLTAEVLTASSFRDLSECQRAFDVWRQVYNRERPHESLDLEVPSSRYRISPRPFPEHLAPIEYGPDDLVRRVDPKGQISVQGRRFRIGKAFCGQSIGLRATLRDGVFSAHFCAQQIGTIDLTAADRGLWTCGQREDALPTGSTGQQQQQVETEV
jgi:transposase InsO family protein